MTSLLKTGAEARIRGLASALPAGSPTGVEHALRAELAEARASMQARDEEIARLRREMKAAVAAAEERGHAAGIEDADARAEDSLAALGEGVASALEALALDLSALERLAPVLAIEVLDKIFGPSVPQADAVARSLELQLRQLSREAVICAYVAPGDFPEPEALAALAAVSGVRIEALPELERGACRLRLRLGGLEIGPRQQWARLRETLSVAAAPGEP